MVDAKFGGNADKNDDGLKTNGLGRVILGKSWTEGANLMVNAGTFVEGDWTNGLDSNTSYTRYLAEKEAGKKEEGPSR